MARAGRRLLRRVGWALAPIVGLPAALLLGGLDLLRWPALQERGRAVLVRQLRERVPGLQLGALYLHPRGELTVVGLRIDEPGGQPALSLRAAWARVDLLALLRRQVQVKRLLLIEPRAYLRRLPDGRLNLTALVEAAPGPASPEPSAWSVSIEDLQMFGGAADLGGLGVPVRALRVDLEGRLRLAAAEASIGLDRLTVDARHAGRRLALRASGGVRVAAAWTQGVLDLRASGLPGLRLLRLSSTLRGPPGRMRLGARLDGGDAGRLSLSGWLERPLRYRLRAAFEGLRPGLWLPAFKGSRLDGAAEARGRGSPLDAGELALSRLSLGTSRVAGIPISSLSARGRLRARRWYGEADLRLPGAALELEGAGDLGGRLAVGLEGRLIPSERLPARLGALQGKGTVRLRVEGSGRRLRAAMKLALGRLAGEGWSARDLRGTARASGLPGRPRVQVRLDARELRLGTGPAFRELHVRGSGEPGAVEVQAHAGGAEVRARLQTSVRRRGEAWLARLGGLELRDPRLSLSLRQPTALSWSPEQGLRLAPTRLAVAGGELEVDGRLQPGPPARGELRVRASRLALPGAGRLSGRLQARLRSSRVLAARGDARLERGGALRVALRLPLQRDWRPDPRRAAALELDLRRLDLRRLAGLLPGAPADLAGLLSARASLTGSLDDPRLQSSLDLAQGRARGLTGLQLRARLSVEEQVSRVRLEVQPGGGPLATIEGRVALPARALSSLARGAERRVPDAPVAFEVRVPPLGADLLATLARLPLRPEGQVSLQLSVGGSLQRPRGRLDLATRGLVYGPYRLERLEAGLRMESAETTRLTGDLRLHGAPLLELRLETGGLYDLVAGSPSPALRGRVAVPGFWLGALSLIRPDLGDFGGLLRAEARLSGTLEEPGLDAWLEVREPELRGRRLERLRAGLRLDGGSKLTADLDLRQLAAGGLELHLETGVRGDRQPLRARLSAERLELDQLQGLIPSVSSLGGRLDGLLQATGSPRDPRLEGELRLSQGRLGLPGVPTLEGLGLRVRMAGDQIRLAELHLPLGEGKLMATGTARLQELWARTVQLRVTAEALPLELAGVTNASLDGRLEVSLDLDRRRGLRGEVALEKGRVKLAGLPGAARRLHPAGPLPDLRFVETLAEIPKSRDPAAAQRRPAGGRRAPPFPIELRVRAASLLVRGKDVDTEITADVTLRRRRRRLALLGEVRALGGWVEILRRRYEVEEALVRFTGQRPPNPSLAVTLTRLFPDARVFLKVAGTARDPQLELSSDPPVYDRAQIIALVLTGQPTMAVEGGGEASLGVASLVLQLVVGKITDAIAPGVGLDVVRVAEVNVGEQTGGPAVTSQKATELEVGKYLTERLYLGYRRLFGAPQDENSNEGRLEYRISSSWSLQAIFGDAGVGGLDLFWTRIY